MRRAQLFLIGVEFAGIPGTAIYSNPVTQRAGILLTGFVGFIWLGTCIRASAESYVLTSI